MKRVFSLVFAWCLAGSVMAGDLTWLTSLPDARAEAAKEHKLVLLNFTGSDWCVWCKKLDAEIFSKPGFAQYARTNLVLVEVDFPANKPQSGKLKVANMGLEQKYDVRSFPTLLAMKPDGTVVWKQVGYLPGGPPAIIAELNKAKTK